MEKITQSLAGRIINFKLYPFTLNELFYKTYDTDIEQIFKIKQDKKKLKKSLDEIIFAGFYPRIHDKNLTPGKWIESYIQTYVERDIRMIINVKELKLFENFLKICAANSGQIINYASISNSIGVSQQTVKSWISLLEVSGIILILQPHFKNYKKRIIKAPKLYFIDTGLLCYLLSIRKPLDLKNHPLYGNIFETLIISEFYKRILHIGEKPPIYYWRDKTGNEIDLLVDYGLTQFPLEIKSSKTFNLNFTNIINKWLNLENNTNSRGLVLYRGEQVVGNNKDVPAAPWYCL